MNQAEESFAKAIYSPDTPENLLAYKKVTSFMTCSSFRLHF